LDVELRHEFAVEFDDLVQRSHPVELQVEAEQLLTVDGLLPQSHCACQDSQLAVLGLVRQVFANGWREGVAVVEAHHVQQEHHALLAGLQVKIPDLGLLAVAVHAADSAEGVGAGVGVAEQLLA
jgi:hypothetical protein